MGLRLIRAGQVAGSLPMPEPPENITKPSHRNPKVGLILTGLEGRVSFSL